MLQGLALGANTGKVALRDGEFRLGIAPRQQTARADNSGIAKIETDGATDHRDDQKPHIF